MTRAKKSMSLLFRRFRNSDLKGVMKIAVHDGWLHNRWLLLFTLKYGKWFDRIRECLISHSFTPFFTNKYDRASFTAVKNNKIIGAVAVDYFVDDVWRVGQLVVHPRYQRKGIATRLLEKAIYYVKKHGGKGITTWIETDNIPAVEFYRNLGFKTRGFRLALDFSVSRKSRHKEKYG